MKSFAMSSRSRVLYWLTAIVVFSAVSISVFAWHNKNSVGAQVSSFYATSCLGGWQNTGNATGNPDLKGDDPTKYSEVNSALLSNSTGDIYCGAFKGRIPDDAMEKRIVLKFSWATKDIPNTASVIQIQEVLRNENIETLDEKPVEVPPVQEEIKAVEEVKVEEVKEEVKEESTPAPTEEVTIFDRLFSKVYAEEIQEENSATTTETKVIEPVKEIPGDAILEIVYTLDGQNWNTLGYVSSISNDVSFEMPKDAVSTIADVEKVQIGIRTISTYDHVPAIYLDSVWLEVEYYKGAVTKGIQGFKVFVLTQDKLEASINDWLSSQYGVIIDDLKVENYGGGGYLVVLSYHNDGGEPTSARVKLIMGDNSEADAQAFLATLSDTQTVRSITATTGTFSGVENTTTVPLILIVYE